MAAKSLFFYALALIGNVVGWVLIGDNANERYPFWVFVTCILSFFIAGNISVQGKLAGEKLQWVAWSVLVGIVEACLLCFAV